MGLCLYMKQKAILNVRHPLPGFEPLSLTMNLDQYAALDRSAMDPLSLGGYHLNDNQPQNGRC